MDPKIQRSLDEIFRLQKEIARLEVERELRVYRYPQRSSQGFPFDLLENLVRGILSLLERSVRGGVDAFLNLFDRVRSR